MGTIGAEEGQELLRLGVGKGGLNLLDDARDEFVDREEHVALRSENPSNRVLERRLIEFTFEELFAQRERPLVVVFGRRGPSFSVRGRE